MDQFWKSDHICPDISVRRNLYEAYIRSTLLHVCECELIDVIIEVSGKPNTGTQVALSAIKNNKHIVMMNVETDVTVGRYLSNEAKKSNLVYTLGSGDEPSAAMEIINFVKK